MNARAIRAAGAFLLDCAASKATLFNGSTAVLSGRDDNAGSWFKIMIQFLKMPDDLDVSYLAADEVHFRTIAIKNRIGLFAKRWRPEFVTNLVAPKAGKVLFNAMGRDSKALAGALAVLSPEQKRSVRFFAVDMHDPFIKTMAKNVRTRLFASDFVNNRL